MGMRGRLSFTQCWCFGDVQPTFYPSPCNTVSQSRGSGQPNAIPWCPWGALGLGILLCSKEEMSHPRKAELSITTIPSCPLAQLFRSQVKANKDHRVPHAHAVAFLAPMVREALISFLSLSPMPAVSSRCWRALHGQQPACGNNESKSGSAILYKPLSALCVCICKSSRSPFSPFPLFPNPPPSTSSCSFHEMQG